MAANFVYPPNQLPGELGRLLGGADAPKGPPTPVSMPSKNHAPAGQEELFAQVGVPLMNRTASPPKLEVRSQGFYDDIVRARGELVNRSGIDQQLTY